MSAGGSKPKVTIPISASPPEVEELYYDPVVKPTKYKW